MYIATYDTYRDDGDDDEVVSLCFPTTQDDVMTGFDVATTVVATSHTRRTVVYTSCTTSYPTCWHSSWG